MYKVHAAVYNKQGFIPLEQIQQIIKLKIKKKYKDSLQTKQFAHGKLTVHCIHILSCIQTALI
jgi:hypothetical protein